MFEPTSVIIAHLGWEYELLSSSFLLHAFWAREEGLLEPRDEAKTRN